MSEEYKAALRRIYEEVFNQGKLDAVDEIIAPNAIDHENDANGPDGLKQTVTMFRTAFPDLKLIVHDVMADGDKVVSRATMTGTHKGEFMGIAPTGKRVEVAVIDIVRFADGKAVEHWGLADNLAMMQQLGAVPPIS